MVKKLKNTELGFEGAFTEWLGKANAATGNVSETVADILKAVQEKGDAALLKYTKEFDRLSCKDAAELRVSRAQIQQAFKESPEPLKQALQLAAERIAAYHEAMLPETLDFVDEVGVRLGNRWVALESVGIYVPGGLASYPSSVLMNAIPARVAGVERIVMAVPAPKGALNPLVLAAAHIAGIEEIYTIGGAQAIAALAYGTRTIPAVDKIVGPGNAYVAEAKRQLFGRVGIDMVAGPSEILVIADEEARPEWLAADLLSQAEHDVEARAILITDDEDLAVTVEAMVEQILPTLTRKDIAAKSWKQNGLILVVEDLVRDAPKLADRIAAEHVEICTKNPQEIATKLRHAGALFLGAYTPEAMGDYIAGPSHVLPTGGTARFSSGLSVYDLLRRQSVISCTEKGFMALADATAALAEAEGLEAHALSVKVRSGGKDE